MKYAEHLADIPNAFKLGPLEPEELERFFCNETMEFRTGDKYDSPIRDIYEDCQFPSDNNAFLLLGHRGCGKSTELNKMSQELEKNGYQVVTVRCNLDLDLINPVYTDLLILMGEALLKIAEKVGCTLDRDIKKELISFWTTELTEIGVIKDSSEAAFEAGMQVETPSFLSSVLKIFASAKANLRFSSEKRTEYKTKLTPRAGDWLFMLNSIAYEITTKLEGKQPIIIFEDLDKINPDEAWNIFSNQAATLSGVRFPVIYTFPIALSYDPRFASLEGFYKPKTLPMIKQETIAGEKYQDGIDIITKIVEKRAEPCLFEEDVLVTLIKKTGGSLRDLFACINSAAKIAIRKKTNVISKEDIDISLKELKSSLTRRIERKNYDFLADICQGNRQNIEDKAMLLDMLRANVVLEYNSERWHNTHPLVTEFLTEQGLVKNERS